MLALLALATATYLAIVGAMKRRFYAAGNWRAARQCRHLATEEEQAADWDQAG